MDSDSKNIHFRRGLLMQDFALIEMAMNRLISFYFFKNPQEEKFISELLQNEYFSFELRKKIFKIAFESLYPHKKFPWKKINSMQKLRNISAHSRMNETNLIDSHGNVIKKIKVPFYLYNGEEIDVKTLHEEFRSLNDDLVKIFNEIKKDTNLFFSESPLIII